MHFECLCVSDENAKTFGPPLWPKQGHIPRHFRSTCPLSVVVIEVVVVVFVVVVVVMVVVVAVVVVVVVVIVVVVVVVVPGGGGGGGVEANSTWESYFP